MWLAAVLAVAAIGTAGYLVMGWSIDDAAYMTGITLTTVGYKEVRELDGLARAWTVLVAIAGVGDHLRIGRDRRGGGAVGCGQRTTGGEFG